MVVAEIPRDDESLKIKAKTLNRTRGQHALAPQS